MKRNPMTVGQVYQVDGLHQTHESNRTVSGDILLCVEHTGDAHYVWARLVENQGNDETRYFNIDKIYSAYVLTGKELLNTEITDRQILNAILSLHIPGRTAVTVPRTSEEIKKRKDIPCMLCGNKPSDCKEK